MNLDAWLRELESGTTVVPEDVKNEIFQNLSQLSEVIQHSAVIFDPNRGRVFQTRQYMAFDALQDEMYSPLDELVEGVSEALAIEIDESITSGKPFPAVPNYPRWDFDLSNLPEEMPKGIFMMASETLLHLHRLKGADKRYITEVIPNTGSQYTVLGIRVVFNEWMDDDVIIFIPEHVKFNISLSPVINVERWKTTKTEREDLPETMTVQTQIKIDIQHPPEIKKVNIFSRVSGIDTKPVVGVQSPYQRIKRGFEQWLSKLRKLLWK